MPVYAVVAGYNPGIYCSWDDCRPEVEGYSNAVFRKFSTTEEALDFIEEWNECETSDDEDDFSSYYEELNDDCSSDEDEGPFYAVAVGRQPGIYSTWDECKDLVLGYSNNKCKKFNSIAEAEAFIEENRNECETSVIENMDDYCSLDEDEGPFYAVAVGHEPGIYSTWDECQYQVLGYSNNKCKKFNSRAEAEAFVEKNRVQYAVAVGYRRGIYYTWAECRVQVVGYRHSKYKKCTSRAKALAFLDKYRPVYAVAVGYRPGIYYTWRECRVQVEGYSNNKYKKCYSIAEAQAFLDGRRPVYAVAVGYRPGIYHTWKTCKVQVLGFRYNKYKKCYSIEEARAFIDNHRLVRTHSTMFDYNGEYVVVYTDGCCLNNGRYGAQGGVGVWFADGHHLNVSKPLGRRATNNVAEIVAARIAIQQAVSAGIDKLQINTDSQFLVNAMTKWIKKYWLRNGWRLADGTPVQNRLEFEELNSAVHMLDDVKWFHVRGHSHLYGNDQADKLAKDGASHR